VFTALVTFLEQHIADDKPKLASVPQQPLRLAAAALLVEMARADFDEADTELEQARGLLTERYGLSPEDAAQLLSAAQAESDRAVSLFRFTHLVNQHLGPADKLALMEMLWEVAYADGRLDKHEDALMHKLADLLYVPLKDLMLAKEQVKAKKRER
jgi:uncharacterized tellurite resistance protein B-like protein